MKRAESLTLEGRIDSPGTGVRSEGSQAACGWIADSTPGVTGALVSVPEPEAVAAATRLQKRGLSGVGSNLNAQVRLRRVGRPDGLLELATSVGDKGSCLSVVSQNARVPPEISRQIRTDDAWREGEVAGSCRIAFPYE